MDTALTKSGSKWIATKPLYPGDLIHNMGCYYPVPDYNDPYWKLLHMNAEDFTYADGMFKWAYPKQAMVYASASSGWMGRRTAERFADQVLNHSVERLTNEGTPFFSDQRLADVIDHQSMADVFAHNYANNDRDMRLAAQNLPDVFIYGPAHREEFLRNLGAKHAITRGAFYEDAIFELHFWGPRLLHRDTTHGIYVGDHAWSRNGAMEKGIGLAIQYGSPLPLDIRMGETFHVVDVLGRDVSVTDQAWEDARHLVYEAGRTIESNGKEYERRSDTAAALLLSRFMHDHYWRTGKGNLDKDRAHPAVKAHYADPAQVEKFDRLRAIMLPFLATQCNTPTLQKILENDPHLKSYWHKHVMPTLGNLPPREEYTKEILGYLPRGGYTNSDLHRYVKESADPPLLAQAFGGADLPDVPNGLPKDPFSSHWDPGIYNDRRFAMLGYGENPDAEPDPDHLTFAQAACEMKINAALTGGIPPLNAPHRVLYLDDPAGGVRASAWKHEHDIDNPSEMAAKFDAFAQGGDKFSESVARESGDDLRDRVRALAKGNGAESWREKHGIGLVDCLSDIKAALDYTGRREGTDTERHEALAAEGAMHVPALAAEALARRLIALEENGIVIPYGHLTDLQLWCCSEGLSAALGKTPRAYSGGKYKFNFFMDFDHWKPTAFQGAPQSLDLADMVIHLGLMAKADLEKPDPARRRALYVVLARYLDAYERVLDPVRRNHVTLRDKFTGQDHAKPIIDLKQVRPGFLYFMNFDSGLPAFADAPDLNDQLGNPEYSACFNDAEYQSFRRAENLKDPDFYSRYMQHPAEKARLAKMIWFWMRAEMQEIAPGRAFVVPGNLIFRGIRNFDHFDLRDLHKDYSEGLRAWQNMSAYDRANIFRQQGIHIGEPGVTRR